MSNYEALHELYLVDQQVRGLQSRLDAATTYVRVQTNKLDTLNKQLAELSDQHRQAQASEANLENDIKGAEQRIEKLREQMNSAKTNKEYSAFLVEVNTLKADKSKLEERALELLGESDKLKERIDELKRQVESLEKENDKLETKLREAEKELRENVGGGKANEQMAAMMEKMSASRKSAKTWSVSNPNGLTRPRRFPIVRCRFSRNSPTTPMASRWPPSNRTTPAAWNTTAAVVLCRSPRRWSTVWPRRTTSCCAPPAAASSTSPRR